MPFLAWLFGSRTGREILAVVVVVGVIWAGWAHFKSVYKAEGYQECKAKWDKAIADANDKQEKENQDRAKKGSEIAADTKTAADEVVTDVDTKTQTKVEDISNAYKQPPRTKPVARESCVHPVDNVVQDRINAAVAEANAAARRL